jgi:pyruvate/2-oxoglutarate dehydrogenase complex dihydrolipoamide acyltransferase (E2) component
LAAALEEKDWDPSVKALVPFPRVLQMMNDELEWMEKLGDAFLAQEADVMESVQRLRQEAQAAGKLQSTSEQVVTTEGQTIVIVPANPEVVYVPVYNPLVVYGVWPYPAYPPYYFPPPPGYVFGNILLVGIGFGIGFAIVEPLWGWDRCDWVHRRIYIEVNKYNVINRYEIEHRHRPRVTRATWEHDPYHRRGVPYPNPAVRARFVKPMVGSPEARRAYRGFEAAPAVRRAPAEAPRVQQPPTGPRPSVTRRAAPAEAPRAQQPPTRQRPSVTRRAAPAEVPRVQQAPTAPPPSEVQRAAPGQAPAVQRPSAIQRPVVRRAPVVQPTAPPAFGGITRGSDVRIQSERGRMSRETPVQRERGPAVRTPARPDAAPRGTAPRGTAPSGGRSSGGQRTFGR